MAIEVSLREIFNKYADCEWAVVPMDFDGGMTPWFGAGGIMMISLEVRRTIKRADMWALSVVCELCGSSEIFSDSRGAVQV